MHRLNTLNQKGHTEITWEPGTESERRAHEEFDRIVKNGGGLAYVTTKTPAGPKHEQIRKFDPDAEEITIHRAFAGG